MSDTLLDRLQAKLPQASRQTLRRMVEAGRVSVNQTVAKRAGQAVSREDRVDVLDQAKATPKLVKGPTKPKPPARLRVIHEDDDVVVVDKPPGLLTSTVPNERRPTLLAMVREHVAAPGDRRARVGLIHRLDRDAGGLLVFSKNDGAYRSLKTQFFRHSVERMYLAAVQAVPEPRQGRIESHLVELPDGTVRSSKAPGRGERAVSEYEMIATAGKRSLLRVMLLTGRKHQIRVHLSERGWPIVGDDVYGQRENVAGARPGRLMLAAVRLAFDHPATGQRVTFERAAPAAMAKLFPGVAAAGLSLAGGSAGKISPGSG
ncbi:MAG: RluA family pseudouridine synthase [Tepidisphaeraceae bacterium]